MRMRPVAGLLLLLLSALGIAPAFAGDSMYGTVTAVKRADLVRLEDKFGGYDIRIVGIVVPEQGRFADDAVKLVSRLVLEKPARMRLERRISDGEMLARLLTADPAIGIKDVGLELVRAGLARRDTKFDYKYNELAIAEREARAGKRGLWGAQ